MSSSPTYLVTSLLLIMIWNCLICSMFHFHFCTLSLSQASLTPVDPPHPQLIMQDQDEQLELVTGSIRVLKDMSGRIGDELDDQAVWVFKQFSQPNCVPHKHWFQPASHWATNASKIKQLFCHKLASNCFLNLSAYSQSQCRTRLVFGVDKYYSRYIQKNAFPRELSQVPKPPKAMFGDQ